MYGNLNYTFIKLLLSFIYIYYIVIIYIKII